MIAFGNSRTATAESEKLTFGAFFEILIDAVFVHLRTGEQVIQIVGQCIAHLALHTPASIAGTVGEDREMTIATIASVIDDVVIGVFLRVKKTMLVFE